MTNENKYSAYRVLVPYTCCVTLPNDSHMTKITIETTSEVVRYGKNKDDISQQMEIDNIHGKSIYANHILNWIGERVGNLNPRDAAIEYGLNNQIIEPMTDEQIVEYTDSCINDGV